MEAFRAPGATWGGAGNELELTLEYARASARTTSAAGSAGIRLPRVLTYWSA